MCIRDRTGIARNGQFREGNDLYALAFSLGYQIFYLLSIEYHVTHLDSCLLYTSQDDADTEQQAKDLDSHYLMFRN